MRNNKKEDFLNMSDALSDFKAQNKLNQGFLKVDVNDAWKEVMGPGVMSYTTQIKFTGEKLFIDLSSSVLRQELSYGRSKIVDNLNKHLGKEVIKTLVLR
ncbi:DUF721 domain-containing protein [Nonlabens marinus]|uniref:Zn-ribbon-containing, possibly RNA-binding protein and truncated derivatives n=1 Tax=Nonlabens marinus S1-08 TaxID=1454201 RepID=W8VRZ8_9FLAO|nr:DUF721 domain-containing protein [Nonlabens marinus]BAO55920.1 zn-ribbon-containing, possibly RNA-binding protein and truncated derivatives [Nonlabens marinus S1-08]